LTTEKRTKSTGFSLSHEWSKTSHGGSTARKTRRFFSLASLSKEKTRTKKADPFSEKLTKTDQFNELASGGLPFCHEGEKTNPSMVQSSAICRGRGRQRAREREKERKIKTNLYKCDVQPPKVLFFQYFVNQRCQRLGEKERALRVLQLHLLLQIVVVRVGRAHQTPVVLLPPRGADRTNDGGDGDGLDEGDRRVRVAGGVNVIAHGTTAERDSGTRRAEQHWGRQRGGVLNEAKKKIEMNGTKGVVQ
jgi:hypothetical protein